jgi:hypothetical protein
MIQDIDNDVTDQFKEGFVELFINTLSSPYINKEYTMKIHGDSYKVVINQNPEIKLSVSFSKVDSYNIVYGYPESMFPIRPHHDKNDKIINYTTTEELNKIIKSYNYDDYYGIYGERKNEWIVYADQECLICKKKKPNHKFIALNKCKHEFCINCLDSITSMAQKYHKCAICHEQWMNWEDYYNNDDEVE